MIEKLNIKGELAIVSGHGISKHSLEGWELVAIINESVVTYVDDEAIQHYPGSGSSTVTVKKAIPFSQASYLMRRNEESVIAMLGEKNKTLEEALAKQKTDTQDIENALNAEIESKNQIQELLDQTAKVREQENEQFHELRDSYQKMEDDLAKVREAIGTQRMHEILAAD